MTTDATPIREDDLHAYVDGFLDPGRRAAVERYLTEHPDAARRVAAWQEGGQALRDALAFKAEEPVPFALNTSHLLEARLANRRAPWKMAAGVVLALMVGGASGYMVRGPSFPTGIASVGMEAAAAYRVFAMDAQHPVEFGPDQQAQMVSWTTRQFGHPIAPPDLSRAGFQLMGGRPMATMHGAGCMFLYENAKGQRIALFIRPMEQRGMNAPMRPTHDEDTSGYAWAHDGIGFGVVAAAPAVALHDLSNNVRDAMGRQI